LKSIGTRGKRFVTLNGPLRAIDVALGRLVPGWFSTVTAPRHQA